MSNALGLGPDGLRDFVGTSRALRDVLARFRRAAATNLTVLILGETGTGKGLAARYVHAHSQLSGGPFVHLNCGAMPEGLVESELFGHERGAFTGAERRRLGKVELAAGGTLFLDEVGDLSAAAQVKLLHLLEERTFERVGGTATLHADVRVVAATNRDLTAMVEGGTFRQDLYYRLEAFRVHLPPLRERREDIPLLAAHFTARMAIHLDRPPLPLDPASLAALLRYDWPGNVRELEHALQRAVVVARGSSITTADLNLQTEAPAAAGAHLSMAESERSHIMSVLAATGWRIKGPGGTAEVLATPVSTLRSRMRKLGIEPPE